MHVLSRVRKVTVHKKWMKISHKLRNTGDFLRFVVLILSHHCELDNIHLEEADDAHIGSVLQRKVADKGCSMSRHTSFDVWRNSSYTGSMV